MIQLDDWQQKVLDADGNLCLRSGRQVGKSTIVSMKAGEFALTHPKKVILVISATERQSYLLFEKILGYIYNTRKASIKSGKDRPTKHKIMLKNGSVIHCVPTGETGYGIRGFTIDMLIADEAAFIPEEVWEAVTPMLAVTKGDIILLSTPHGREGYFARCFQDDTYTQIHVSSEECPRINREFLAHEKLRMTRLQYSQEYLGEFCDELMQFFPDNLIKTCQTGKRVQFNSKNVYFLGVDVARMGGDECSFEIIDRTDRSKLRHVENITQVRNLITDTTRQIISLNKAWKFRRIYLDSGGMGVGVFDFLIEEPDVKRNLVSIDNASRSLTPSSEDKQKVKRLLKEDLYNNLLNLMERGEIELLDDAEVFQSLKSVQIEFTEKGNLRIFGRYTHIAEGLIRAAWCVKDKSLNLFVY